MSPSSTTAPSIESNNKEDLKKINAQLGAGFAKTNAESLFIGKKGQTFRLDGSQIKATDSVFIKQCEDCVFQIEEMCTKIFVEGCKGLELSLNGKIITNTVEIWKCDNVQLMINTAVLTLQVDLCNQIKVVYKQQEHFNRLVWSAVEDLELKFLDEQDLLLQTGVKPMLLSNPKIIPETDQFIIRLLQNKLTGKTQILNELIVRLENGFPTTEREARQFEQRQEANLQALARELLGKDIVIGKKKDDKPKVGRNDACTCGSGKKYKKCCGTDAI